LIIYRYSISKIYLKFSIISNKLIEKYDITLNIFKKMI